MYVVGYTLLLKRRTPQNIVWGGAAGCMQILIGWAAVTGSLSWAPMVLFGVVFFWTPPHYWPLSLRFKDDYAAAGVPMLPVVASAVDRRARDHRLLLGDGAHVAAARARPRTMTPFYAVAAVLLGGAFLFEAHALLRRVRRGENVTSSRCGCSTARSATWRCCSSPSQSTRSCRGSTPARAIAAAPESRDLVPVLVTGAGKPAQAQDHAERGPRVLVARRRLTVAHQMMVASRTWTATSSHGSAVKNCR